MAARVLQFLVHFFECEPEQDHEREREREVNV